MQTFSDSGFWADLSPEGRGAPLCDEQRAHLLDHLSWCAECREKAASAASIDAPMNNHSLSRDRSRAIRDRLLQRARNDGRVRQPKSGFGVAMRAGAGWIVAAGLASLLLMHHAFHRPLVLGWVIAGVLGLICFGLVLQATYLRSQLDRVRTAGHSTGHDHPDSGKGGSGP